MNEIKYKRYRNSICNLTGLSKKQYYYDDFNIRLTEMKKTWAGINHILNRNIKNNEEISVIKDHNNNNEIVRDPLSVSNIFNEHFASVGS